MEGVSLVPAFRGEKNRGEQPLYWVCVSDWNLVAERGKDWELYNIAQDRSETQNLAESKPDMVEKLAEQYDTWAARTGATLHEAAKAKRPSQQSQLFNLDAILSKPKNR